MRRTKLVGLIAAVGGLLLASSAAAQPRNRVELVRRVDTSVLVSKHRLSPSAIETLDLQVLLSIEAVEPATPFEGDTLTVTYVLTNFTLQAARGTTTGQVGGDPLVTPDGAPPASIDLAPGASMTGVLRTKAPLPIGNRRISLRYADGLQCTTRPGPFGKPVRVCVASITADTSADLTVTIDPRRIDSDGDGIPDVVEQELLARFRPYYRFSKYYDSEEGNRPTDVAWFVARSELQDHHSEVDTPVFTQAELAADPSRLLKATASIGSSDLQVKREETDYYLNLDNRYRPGEGDWTRIVNEAVGLYGHVSPLRSQAKPDEIDEYKIEYWQFYAFNPVPGQIECFSTGVGSDAHEGDWEGVEVVVKSDKRTISRVRHHVHSTDVVFDLTTQPGPPDNGFSQLTGVGAQSLSFDLYVNRDMESRHNAQVRFFCGVDGCTHPVVFIEHGGHASWPTEYWNWPGVLNHDGNSAHQYLVATPVNLGEVDRPNSSCASCALVLRFNGHWGACGRNPPHGPPLKYSWGKR